FHTRPEEGVGWVKGWGWIGCHWLRTGIAESFAIVHGWRKAPARITRNTSPISFTPSSYGRQDDHAIRRAEVNHIHKLQARGPVYARRNKCEESDEGHCACLKHEGGCQRPAWAITGLHLEKTKRFFRNPRPLQFANSSFDVEHGTHGLVPEYFRLNTKCGMRRFRHHRLRSRIGKSPSTSPPDSRRRLSVPARPAALFTGALAPTAQYG